MSSYDIKRFVIDNARKRGSADAGFIGIIESIVERAAEFDDPNTYIAEEVKETLRAYKEVVGE